MNDILKKVCCISEAYTAEEQLNKTEEYFFRNYNSENPLAPVKGDSNIKNQIILYMKENSYEVFRMIRTGEPILNMAAVSYLGYSKETLLAILHNIVRLQEITQEMKIEYISKFSSISDKLEVGITKSLILQLIVLINYENIEAAASLALVLYTCTQLSKGV